MKSNRIYLPTLERVRIVNYSLYKEDIDYKFIEGINLIIGGNGVGKTTFINIVKYALIGLYKKDLDVRNYKGEKRLIRGKYANSNAYFRNRTYEKETDKDGYVELYFKINETSFYVKRALYDVQLLSASYVKGGNKTDIHGKSAKQDSYKGYENFDSEPVFVDDLQYNYEKAVATETGLSNFDDFIFFVNQILLFGETRENVLWSENVQERLLSNFFNDAELERKRKECSLEAKYQDSIARHKQEEIKAINRVLMQLDINSAENANTGDEKTSIMQDIEDLEQKLERIQEDREALQKSINSNYNIIAELSQKVNEIEKEKERAEEEFNREFWPGVNPKYLTYKRQYISNKICPFCNSDLGNREMIDEVGKCFFCQTSIAAEKEVSEKVLQIGMKLKDIMDERNKYEYIVNSYDKEIKELDTEYRETKVELFHKQTILRAMEQTEKNDQDEESSYRAMLNRIDELSLEKAQAQAESEKKQKECQEIMNNIEENMLENTRNISKIFSDFAEAFMKLPCYLTLEKTKRSNIDLFFPVIDNKIRYDAEELSESQRFFVDYSFRMSILSYFYQCPSFYICETPDSSLDISYEENAADTFMKYLEKPNSLILTSNLNNSTFVKSILLKTPKRKVLNLLKYGKISKVQQNHELLNVLSKEIEEMCDE